MSLWAKLSVDILGDPKLMRASRKGSKGVEMLPWFIAWAKRAEDGGRLTIDGEPAEISDFLADIPGATSRSIEAAISSLIEIGVLQREDDGALTLVRFSKRQYGKPSNTPERTRERKRVSRASSHEHSSDVTPKVTRAVTPNVTPQSGERRAESKEIEQRAESGEAKSRDEARDTLPDADQAPDPDPFVVDSDRAAPPAPLVELPVEAERLVEQLYSLASDKRRLDVRRQLYDALDPRLRGARLRRGTFVKARSSEHLAACCRAVMDDPPRNIDAAIVIVLEKLLDPPPGPTVTERHKAVLDASTQEEEAYQRAARAAGVTWANQNPELYAPILEAVDAEFNHVGGNGTSTFVKIARDTALGQRCAAAAGFPSFTAWQQERRETRRVG